MCVSGSRSRALKTARPTLHVVVSCKSRKTVGIPSRLCISTIGSASLRDRAREWIGRLEKVAAGKMIASNLYAGDHWKVVLRIPSAAENEVNVRLWVASAGYGLV